MRSFEAEDTGWWQVEPPDHELQPLDNEPPEDADYYNQRRKLVHEAMGHELLDGTQPHPMFKDVMITDDSDGLRFKVPRRYIDTPNAGKWAFDVYGGRRHFKERDHFGNIRFTESGYSFWVPHLFPFEETAENGLPLILDRERCEVTVTLQHIEGNADMATTAAVQTPHGLLIAHESALSYNPDFIRIFDEFSFQDKPLVADTVTFQPDRWRSIDEYLREKQPDIDRETYLAIMLDKQPIPEEYFAQYDPNDWQDREPSDLTGTAFGTIWIPVDTLRHNPQAEISFPCFKV